MTGRLGRAIAAAIAATLFTCAQAQAGPADLDPSFGTGGLVIVPGTDRFDPEAAPLLRADGKVTVAGLLRNSSDRVFLARFNPAGTLDTAFDSDGEVHTNVVAAPDRRAAVAQTGDGRTVVAGGSTNSGRITLERYTANGAPDTTFGSNGKMSASISANYLKVVSALVQPDGKTLVSAYTNHGGTYRSFVILRFTNKAIDTTFGKLGVARIPFGTRNSTAWDLAMLPNGQIVAAGSVGDGDATNLAAVRLNSDGALDTAFATSGRLERDTTGTGKADYATGLVTGATGAFSVTGPAGTAGMLARFTSTGAPDGAFGVNGVKFGGFAPAGSTFRPEDLATDLAGRLVAVGSTVETATNTTRWTVVRATTAGANPLDGGFGTEGVVRLAPCLNHNGFGPTGVAISDKRRIVVLGGCNEDNRVAAVRLLGTDAFLSAAKVSVASTSEAAGRERIPVADINPASVLRVFDDLQGTELRESPLRPNPLRPNPLRPNPLRPNPLRPNTLLDRLPLRPNPLRPNPVSEQILLSSIPLSEGRTWGELLGIEAPTQTLTLADAYRAKPDVVGRLSLLDIDIDATVLRQLSLASLVLGLRPLAVLPAPAGGWCEFLKGQPSNCENGVNPDITTLFELEVLGDDLTKYLERPLKIAGPSILGTGDARAPLAYVPLNEIELSRTPFGSVPAAAVADLLTCGSSCTGTLAERQAADPEGFSTRNLGDLIAKVPVAGVAELTLGQVLAGLVAPSETPLERVELSSLLGAAALRDQDLQTYTTAFTVDCAQSSGLVADPTLPNDARTVPGSARVSVNGGTSTAVPDGKPYDLSSACAGKPVGTLADVSFSFLSEPGSTLGLRDAKIEIRSAFGKVSGVTDVAIDDSRDPGDAYEQALSIEPDALRTGHLAHADDVDSYTFKPTAPGRVTLTLSSLPADYDLLVFGPEESLASSPLRPNPLRPNPLRPNDLGLTTVPDTSQEYTDPGVLPPDTVQDVPLRPNPLRPNPLRPNPLLGLSTNRETNAESVTVTIRPADVGRTFTAQVVGYNGANHAKPYVIRRIDRAAPKPPPCLTRAPLAAGAPGAFPTSVPSSKKTIYLVNLQRLASRDGAAAAALVRQKLDDIAKVTDGIVVPVESDSANPTGSAYAAWDDDQCDPEKANAVAIAINSVVDHVREMGDGLPELRNIVLVGSDDILPQARIDDRVTLANEREYADETVVRGLENAVSAAQRNGYLLTDDPYGDFDPNGRLSVPDVALGRLVETSEDILAQLDGYMSGAKFVTPTDLFVAGYDFLRDGAQAQFDALKGSVTGGARARIDETWDAALAMQEINRPNAGFTAVDAHFNHFQGLPAAAHSGDGSLDLIESSEAAPSAKQVAFSVGCHAGLSLVVPLAGLSPEERRLTGGWVDRYAASNALYVGNTGYGYGDTDIIAMSEKLMADYALQLATKKVTVGQALMLAKQANAQTLTDDYWNKSSMEATFYGLPFYGVGSDGGVGAPALPPVIEAPATVSRLSKPVTLKPSLREVGPPETERGRYWMADGLEPLAIQHRPIQPQTRVDVTPADGLLVHGFLPERFVTTDIPNVDPVLARPTIDKSAREPEPDGEASLFPSANFTTETVATATGRTQRLTAIVGEYRNGSQRLFTEVEGLALRSNSDDFVPALIEQVDGVVFGGAFSVSVETDATDVAGGNVLYRLTSDNAWHRIPLAPVGGGRLGGGGSLPAGAEVTEAKVHVFDEAGNVSTSDNKVFGYKFAPVLPSADGPTIKFDPPNASYYEDSPTITVDPGKQTGAKFEYSIDGAAWQPYTGGFRIPEPDEGEHFVRVRASTGAETLARVAIDSQPPVILAEFKPAPNDRGWNKGDVVATFTCADAVSGVASCPAPRTITGEGRDLSVTVSATDLAGHSGSQTFSGVNIDRTKPVVTGKPGRAPNANGWYAAPVTISFTCTDALSGVGFCSDPQTVGQGTNQTVSGRGVDLADNEGTATVGGLNVDTEDPKVAINQPFGGVLIGRLTGTASDTGGSGIATIVVTYTSGSTTKKTPAIYDAARGTWQADSPGLGFWTATALATDKAGRTGPSNQVVFSVN